jgi:hypothetical protein
MTPADIERAEGPSRAFDFAWLIEFPESGDAYREGVRVGPVTPIQWYCAVVHGDRLLSRTSDANEAMRFARKQDANAMIRRLNDNPHGPTRAYACEHGFLTDAGAAALRAKEADDATD